MTGPGLLPAAAPHTLLGVARKGGRAAQHGQFDGCRRGFYLWSRTRRQECWLGAGRAARCTTCLCRGGSDLPQGCEELGRTGTFSKCSQREPGFPTNLVMTKLVSQILPSLQRPACLLHLLWAAKQIFKVLKSRSLLVKSVLRCPRPVAVPGGQPSGTPGSPGEQGSQPGGGVGDTKAPPCPGELRGTASIEQHIIRGHVQSVSCLQLCCCLPAAGAPVERSSWGMSEPRGKEGDVAPQKGRCVAQHRPWSVA